MPPYIDQNYNFKKHGSLYKILTPIISYHLIVNNARCARDRYRDFKDLGTKQKIGSQNNKLIINFLQLKLQMSK